MEDVLRRTFEAQKFKQEGVLNKEEARDAIRGLRLLQERRLVQLKPHIHF